MTVRRGGTFNSYTYSQSSNPVSSYFSFIVLILVLGLYYLINFTKI